METSNFATVDTLRVIVADPDPIARRSVHEALEIRSDFRLIGECSSGLEAVPLLREAGADVLVCEIELPGIQGFSLVEMLPDHQRPAVIFMNYSDHYAARAFEQSAVDYLLKPFTSERLQRAFDRAAHHLAASRMHSQQPTPQKNVDRRLAIRTGRSVLFLNSSELDWAEAEGKYVRLHMGKETLLLKISISHLEAELDPSQFVRIHRSTLVNVDRVRWVQPWMNGRNYQIVLLDGTRLVLSRKDHLRALTQHAVLSV